MTALPPDTNLTGATITESTFQTAISALRSVVSELTGGRAPQTLAIASDQITPDGSSTLFVDTELSFSTDNLARIIATNYPNGRFIWVQGVSAARVVVLKHLAGGSGQLQLVTGVDTPLDSGAKWVLFRYDSVGQTWLEVLRSFGVQATTALSGVVQLATDAETKAGTVATKALTPANFNAARGNIPYRQLSSAGPLLATDNGALVDVNGNLNLSLFQATAGVVGFSCYIRNYADSGIVTLIPSGTDAIDNAQASILLGPKDSVMLTCVSAGFWRAVGRRRYITISTATPSGGQAGDVWYQV